MSDILTTLLDEMGGVNPLPKKRPEVEEIIAPSGLAIRYEDKQHRYFLNGERVASVSQVLGVLDKPALVWWGMRIGVTGVLALIDSGGLGAACDTDSVVSLLTEHKLTVNHVRDKAGERGTTVHDALELWAREGLKPNPNVYLDEQRGYVEALAAFVSRSRIEPLATETIVGSLEHGFAGRYDLRCLIDGRLTILDLKTSGAIYPEHFLQLEAYEGAGVECGYERTDARVVLRVDRDGSCELRQSPATFDDFLAVKAAYDATTALKKRLKEAA